MESPEEEENLALYQAMTGDPPDNLDEYLRAMKDNQRPVYEMSGDRSTPSPIEESSFRGRHWGKRRSSSQRKSRDKPPGITKIL